MTDFNEWYERTPKNFPSNLNRFEAVMRQAYEAGAASQAVTLRDKFAGQAMSAAQRRPVRMQMHDTANFAYEQADAMLEARKVTGECKA
jgi:hypothetical protein